MAEANSLDAAAQLFGELCEALVDEPGVSVARIMRSDGLNVNGKFFAFLRRDALVLKLPASRVQELVAAGLAHQFEPRPGRLMREWALLDVPATAEEAPALWASLARAALDHVASLKR
jgi:TfoX/Sxy family transcriptional regulator of competence genes